MGVGIAVHQQAVAALLGDVQPVQGGRRAGVGINTGEEQMADARGDIGIFGDD